MSFQCGATHTHKHTCGRHGHRVFNNLLDVYMGYLFVTFNHLLPCDKLLVLLRCSDTLISAHDPHMIHIIHTEVSNGPLDVQISPYMDHIMVCFSQLFSALLSNGYRTLLMSHKLLGSVCLIVAFVSWLHELRALRDVSCSKLP